MNIFAIWAFCAGVGGVGQRSWVGLGVDLHVWLLEMILDLTDEVAAIM